MKHEWDLSPAQARALQTELATRLEPGDRFGPIRRVAGVDVGFESGGRITRAAVAVLDFDSLTLVAHAVAHQPTRFPYVPGLLSFREAPAVLAALERLETLPDLLLCDGQGIAHPRRFGIACHLGLLTDLPAIGVAKTRLLGRHGPVPKGRGQWTPLMEGDEVIGAVLRTRRGVKPVFVSPGHRVGLESAIRLVMRCTPRYRLPETTRLADRLASGRGGHCGVRPAAE
jgi:deoxyribonuclease V